VSDILTVRDLRKTYPGRGFRAEPTEAVRGISFTLPYGTSLGIVGESGSGKTTTARIVCGLERATSGKVLVAGRDLSDGNPPPRGFYGEVQMVFQDPYLSLSPRMTVRKAVGYALKVQGVRRAEREQRVQAAISRVGLPVRLLDRYPHQLSTGQRQRVGIARAIIGEPKLVIADEPVSSLDVSLQTQILNLLVDIQEQTGISYLFISHDLAVVAYLCERVQVMQNGMIVEGGDPQDVLSAPKTPYARLLVEAAGIAELERAGVSGPDSSRDTQNSSVD
jgi:ABC-type glutathione transport system ATPase component